MGKTLVSIICTNYNKGSWIGEAIDSFLMQKTNFDYEIIVVDDKSTDDSPEIIEKYAKEHPRKIKAFYNRKNLGITKTWKKICKHAKGKYIARCDGDDFWTDENKLQMQVDELRKNRKSKWCTTDYDIITPSGKVTHRSANESGINTPPKSYEEMLVTKGMTMASTWLVDTKLMQEINEAISDDAIDDTFNIQLELFVKTKLTYIPKATTVYRLNQGSDSHPTDSQVVRAREEKLLETQLEYINKYKDFKYREIIELLLRENCVPEDRIRLIKKFQIDQKNKETLINSKQREIDAKQREIDAIRESLRYKIGTIITAPVLAIKRAIKRVTND